MIKAQPMIVDETCLWTLKTQRPENLVTEWEEWRTLVYGCCLTIFYDDGLLLYRIEKSNST